MKNVFILAALLATTLVAHAETLRVKIPFAFSATGTKLPAGEYAISAVPNASQVLLIKSTVDASVQAFVFGRVVETKPSEPATVKFDKEALVGVTGSSQKFELSTTGKK